MLLAFTRGLAAAAEEAPDKRYDCNSAKEYVTALEYMRAQKDVPTPDVKAREVATYVSGGCTGAAMRFIRITSLLTRAGVGFANAIEMGMDFSNRSDAEVETFFTVFQQANGSIMPVMYPQYSHFILHPFCF